MISNSIDAIAELKVSKLVENSNFSVQHFKKSDQKGLEGPFEGTFLGLLKK